MLPDKKDLIELLSTRGEEDLEALYKRSYEIKKKVCWNQCLFTRTN
jgi:hypothetical protein